MIRRTTIDRRCIAALLVAMSFGGCDDADDPGATTIEEAEPQPGDPDFVRDSALDVEVISAHDSEASAGMTGNCMSCHQALGPGPGRFTVAGSVVGADGEPEPNPIVELRQPAFAEDGSDIPGELVATIEGDLLGNFYSTAPLPFPEASLVPWVYSQDRTQANHMPFGGTLSGACNVCHVGSNPVDLKPVE
jgi:hypothetical protein